MTNYFFYMEKKNILNDPNIDWKKSVNRMRIKNSEVEKKNKKLFLFIPK